MDSQSDVPMSQVVAHIDALRAEQERALGRIEKAIWHESMRSSSVAGEYVIGSRAMRAFTYFTLMSAIAGIGLVLYLWGEAACAAQFRCEVHLLMVIGGIIMVVGYLTALVGAWRIFLGSNSNIPTYVTDRGRYEW